MCVLIYDECLLNYIVGYVYFKSTLVDWNGWNLKTCYALEIKK